MRNILVYILAFHSLHFSQLEPCTNFECDTTVVRQILNLNGFSHIPTMGAVEATSSSRVSQILTSIHFCEYTICDPYDDNGIVPPDEITTGWELIGKLSGLKNLTIYSQNLSEFPASWCQLQELEVINLQSNPIEIFPGNCQFDSLKILNLKQTSLTEFNILPNSMPNLSYLNICWNKLARLPNGIGTLFSLDTLIANNNQISRLPNSFFNMSNLKFIDVNFNSIDMLQNKIENLAALEHLAIGANQLSDLPDSLKNMKSLTYLTVSDNQLTEVPNWIGNLENLGEIYFHNNDIDSIPSSIGDLTNVYKISAYNNNIRTIPSAVLNIKNLYDFRIQDNELDSLPDSIGVLTNLFNFHLAGNNLDRLPESFSNLKNLSFLSLANNNLTTLPDSIVNISDIWILYLGGNPLCLTPEQQIWEREIGHTGWEPPEGCLVKVEGKSDHIQYPEPIINYNKEHIEIKFTRLGKKTATIYKLNGKMIQTFVFYNDYLSLSKKEYLNGYMLLIEDVKEKIWIPLKQYF